MAYINIIVVQYGNSAATLRCLASLELQLHGGCRVLVIDNASPEIDRVTVSTWCAGRQYITFKALAQNHGYAGGNNIGIAHALRQNADYIFILNNDCILKSDTVKKLASFMDAQPRLGGTAPIILETGADFVYGGRVRWLWPTLQHLKELGTPDYLTGAALFVRREVLERVGAFDERYFLYFEDVDLCLRIRRANWQLAICPTAQIEHMASLSTKKLGREKLFRYHMRNALLFNAKNGPWYVRFILPAWALSILLIQLLLLPVHKSISTAIIRGITDYYTNRFGIIL